jgi:hypothetical protein
MDGLLDNSMIDMVRNLTYSGKDDITVYNNTYRHFEGVKLPIYFGKIQFALAHIYHKIMKLSKVCVFCTSNNYAIKLTNMLRLGNRSVALIHGKEAHFINSIGDEEVSMKQFKNHWYQRLDEIFNEYDILIHTSSITGGISIETEIDAVFGIFLRNTCTCIDFLQGIYRCRNAKVTEIYYKNGVDHNEGHITPYRSLSAMMDNHVDYNDKYKNIECYAEALLNQVRAFRDDILLMNLKLVYGYDIVLIDIEEIEVIDAEGIDYMKMWTDYDRPTEAERNKFLSDEYKDIDSDIVVYNPDDLYLKAVVDVIDIYEITPEQRRSIDKRSALRLFRDKHRWRAYKSKLAKYKYQDISDFDDEVHFNSIQHIIDRIRLHSTTDVLMKDVGDVGKEKEDHLILGYIHKLRMAMEKEPQGLTSRQICDILNVEYIERVGVKSIEAKIKKMGWTLSKQKLQENRKRVWLYRLVEDHKAVIQNE